jgi:5-methylcytosine-specific restriction endonuclease McrA
MFGSTGFIQPVTGGMDTGSKHIGSAAVANGRVLYQASVEIRNDVTGRMEQRRSYRRTRRGRKLRYREPRFDNRGKVGKLAPSIKSKVDSHLREKSFVESILPVSSWKAELASFDIHKISNPSVSKKHGWTYQNGAKKDFYNLKAYILDRDGYACQQCGKDKNVKLHVHHIKFRSEGGTDTPKNLITLCESCHDSLHAGKLGTLIHEKLTKKTASKTKHATEIGIVKSQLKKSDWKFEETFGYETKFKREVCLGLPKTHFNDAVAICLTEGELVDLSNVVYFKKHVCNGDYQQTCGRRSEEKIPTGKIMGFKKFDKVLCDGRELFIKGRMSTGYAILMGIDNQKVDIKPIPKLTVIKRIGARKSCLTSRMVIENSHSNTTLSSSANTESDSSMYPKSEAS